MLKLVHTGDFWFMEYDRRLYRRREFCTTLDEWDVVKTLSETDYDVLKKEFPSVKKLFKQTDAGIYVLKERPPIVPVRNVTPVDNMLPRFQVKSIFTTK